VSATRGERELVAHAASYLISSPMKAFLLYRNFEDLPIFMHHLESVTKLSDKRYRWIALGPSEQKSAGTQKSSTSAKANSSPGALCRTPTQRRGFGAIQRSSKQSGTILTSTFHYDIPAGKLGASLLKLLGKTRALKMQQDLRRFQRRWSDGEIPQPKANRMVPLSRNRGLEDRQSRMSQCGATLE